MNFGELPKGVTQGDISEVLRKVAEPDEEFLFACKITRNFKSEILCISNIGLTLLSSKDLSSVSRRASLSDVTKFKSSWSGLSIGVSGQTSDWEIVLDNSDAKKVKAFDPLSNQGNIREDFDTPESPSDGRKKTLAERIEEKQGALDARREKTSQADQDKRNEGYTREQRDRYGNVLIIEKFAKKKIKIFENGYVSVDGKSPEKLVSAEGSADVTKKSGAGRAVGGVAAFAVAGPLFVGSSNNRRGDVYLTLNTESQVYALSIDLQNAHSAENPVEVMNKILATCKRVIAVNDVRNLIPNEVPAGPDLASQLSSLNDLFQSGVLSEEEFNSAKAKILGT